MKAFVGELVGSAEIVLVGAIVGGYDEGSDGGASGRFNVGSVRRPVGDTVGSCPRVGPRVVICRGAWVTVGRRVVGFGFGFDGRLDGCRVAMVGPIVDSVGTTSGRGASLSVGRSVFSRVVGRVVGRVGVTGVGRGVGSAEFRNS